MTKYSLCSTKWQMRKNLCTQACWLVRFYHFFFSSLVCRAAVQSGVRFDINNVVVCRQTHAHFSECVSSVWAIFYEPVCLSGGHEPSTPIWLIPIRVCSLMFDWDKWKMAAKQVTSIQITTAIGGFVCLENIRWCFGIVCRFSSSFSCI